MNFSIIPIFVLFILSLLSATLMGVFRTHFAKKIAVKQSDYYYQNAIASIVCAISLFALSGFSVKISLFTFLLSVGFGLVTMFQSVLTVKATSIGPWSYTTVITSSSTVLTALSGFVFWGESLGAFKIIGIILMMGCFVFSVEKKEDEKQASAKWLTYCLFVILFSASVGIMQKIHQSSSYKSELWAFLIVAFVISAVFSCALYMVERKKERIETTERKESQFNGSIWKMLALFAVIGVSTALVNAVNLYLSGVVESAVFFPIVNGGALMLSVLSAFIVFREQLTKRQWLGLILGIVALLCLCF